MRQETSILTRNGDKYDLLIQDSNKRVLFQKRDITIQEVVAELRTGCM